LIERESLMGFIVESDIDSRLSMEIRSESIIFQIEGQSENYLEISDRKTLAAMLVLLEEYGGFDGILDELDDLHIDFDAKLDYLSEDYYDRQPRT